MENNDKVSLTTVEELELANEILFENREKTLKSIKMEYVKLSVIDDMITDNHRKIHTLIK